MKGDYIFSNKTVSRLYDFFLLPTVENLNGRSTFSSPINKAQKYVCSLRHKPKNNVVVKKYTLHYLREKNARMRRKNARMRRKLVMRCAREGSHRSIAHTKCEQKRHKNVEEWCA